MSGKRSQKKKSQIMSLVDIVIPVYGQFELLLKCLDSIHNAFKTTLFKIIIVDDNSPEKFILPDEYRNFNVTLKRNTKNFGFPKTCNIGARQGQSPLIFFLNSDVVLEENSGDILVKTMDDPTIGIAGMKLLFPEGLTQEQHKIRPAGKIQHVGHSFNITGDPHHMFVGWGTDNPRVNQFRDVPSVTGAALMVRRNLFKMVKGFDEIYGRGTFEDVDLCFSVLSLGGRIVIQPEAVGTHFVGGSSAEQGFGFPLSQNKQLFYNKWDKK